MGWSRKISFLGGILSSRRGGPGGPDSGRAAASPLGLSGRGGLADGAVLADDKKTELLSCSVPPVWEGDGLRTGNRQWCQLGGREAVGHWGGLATRRPEDQLAVPSRPLTGWGVSGRSANPSICVASSVKQASEKPCPTSLAFMKTMRVFLFIKQALRLVKVSARKRLLINCNCQPRGCL